MKIADPLDIYAYRLGGLWGRIMSLEVFLRIAVLGGKSVAPLNVSVGNEMDPDEINRWAYLSSLVPQYNASAGVSHPE